MNERFQKVSVWLTPLLVLIICVFLYLIGRAYHFRLHGDRSTQIILSAETKEVLSKFGAEPIEMYAFFSNDHSQRDFIKELLAQYAAASPALRYEVIDPDLFPKKIKQFKVETYGVLLVKARAREIRLEDVSEQALTNALVKISTSYSKTIYFIKGHNEASIHDQEKNGYFLFAKRLTDAGYEVKEKTLADSAMKKADLLILAGPHLDFTPEEIDILKNLFYAGVPLFLAFDPMLPGEGENIQLFMRELGVTLDPDIVIDQLSGEVTKDYLVAMLTKYPAHSFFSSLPGPLLCPLTRSVQKASKIPVNLKITELALTNANTWGETNLKDLEEGKTNYDEGVDLPGPLSVALWVEGSEKKNRLLVMGDSDFLNNTNLFLAANKYLPLRVVEQLLEEKPLVQIKPVSMSSSPLVLSPHEKSVLFFSSVFGLPSIFLGMGLYVSVWRKRHE